MDQFVEAKMPVTLPPNNGGKLSVTMWRREAKERKEMEDDITEATSKLEINSESKIHHRNLTYAKRSDVSQCEWDFMVHRHNERTKAERRLFELTKLLPQKLRIFSDPEEMLEYKRLFGQKVPLLEDPIERRKDDDDRYNAIADIIKAREEAGFEPNGEAAKWYDSNLDVTQELNAKFASKYFQDIYELRANRKVHRKFMADNLQIIEQTPGQTIPETRKNWLRSRANVLVCAPRDIEAVDDLRRASIQVVYWIIVRRAKAGIPLEIIHSNPEDFPIAMHVWLIGQPLSFFESDDFQLDTHFDIEIEGFENLTRPKKKEHDENESNDGAITSESMEAAEFNPEMDSKLDAELDVISSGDGQQTETSPATAVLQISTHKRQPPISHHPILAHQGYYDDEIILLEPVRARKRQRSSSPQSTITDEDDYDYDNTLCTESVLPIRTTKRRG